MSKILTHSYNELLSITAHCSINVKASSNIFYSQRSLFLFLFLFFSSFFSLLSPLSLSSSLFPVASVFLYFTEEICRLAEGGDRISLVSKVLKPYRKLASRVLETQVRWQNRALETRVLVLRWRNLSTWNSSFLESRSI